mmetsp:Transcript_9371/g.31143  ORF Transcript_9371/g.31143 Transcript_9371/m.31143 type:complete len:236 (-) Transcript_9371:147-854(-)
MRGRACAMGASTRSRRPRSVRTQMTRRLRSLFRTLRNRKKTRPTPHSPRRRRLFVPNPTAPVLTPEGRLPSIAAQIYRWTAVMMKNALLHSLNATRLKPRRVRFKSSRNTRLKCSPRKPHLKSKATRGAQRRSPGATRKQAGRCGFCAHKGWCSFHCSPRRGRVPSLASGTGTGFRAVVNVFGGGGREKRRAAEALFFPGSNHTRKSRSNTRWMTSALNSVSCQPPQKAEHWPRF